MIRELCGYDKRRKFVLCTIYIGNVKRDVVHNVARDVAPYILTLANRNDPICVVSPKVAKASKISVAVTGVISGIIALTFDNVNTVLLKVYLHMSVNCLATQFQYFSLNRQQQCYFKIGK